VPYFPRRRDERDGKHPSKHTKTTTTRYTRRNDNKEYTIFEVNEERNQVTLRDAKTGTTLKMAKQTFANNFKKI
jgi:hypothetical protein